MEKNIEAINLVLIEQRLVELSNLEDSDWKELSDISLDIENYLGNIFECSSMYLVSGYFEILKEIQKEQDYNPNYFQNKKMLADLYSEICRLKKWDRETFVKNITEAWCIYTVSLMYLSDKKSILKNILDEVSSLKSLVERNLITYLK
jgi:hypothetical protein